MTHACEALDACWLASVGWPAAEALVCLLLPAARHARRPLLHRPPPPSPFPGSNGFVAYGSFGSTGRWGELGSATCCLAAAWLSAARGVGRVLPGRTDDAILSLPSLPVMCPCAGLSIETDQLPNVNNFDGG